MKITALLSALNSALAEPFALAWSQDSPRFLLVFTVVYAVAVIVAVTDQKNTRPGAEHGSAAWGDVFRLNKFYMDRHGSNLLLTQHFHIGIDGYKHKHNTNVLIVGGAVGYTGAPYLTAAAAVRTGCGLVSLGVPETIWPVEAAKCVSAMPFPLPDKHGRLSPKAKEEILERAAGCDAVALGPGLGRGDGVTELVLDLLQKIQQPMVLDADGINALEGHIDVLDARRDRITVLTPHDGEFTRIGGDLTGSNRLGAARAFGAAHGCVLVLKGHRTLTAAPAGNVLVNTTGNSGLAKGGSGDVLTGIVAALLAQGATAVRAAAVGVWLHGRAGDLAAERLTPYGMTPEDVVSSLPAAIGEIL